ncbi:MAG TPA: hypothetical protein VKK31_06445, partial [Thermoanaerobaculia bacterium]|nr:hypothetical protein [Thermoanaerobaculia bacterium]
MPTSYRRGSPLSDRTRRLAVLMAGISWLALSVAAPLAALQTPAPPQQPLVQRLQVVLRTRLPASGQPPELMATDGATFRATPALPCFYDRRGFAPAWTGDAGLRPEAGELLAAVADAAGDGLRPEDYHLGGLEQRIAQARSQPAPGDLAELDLLLTDAFLRLAADLRNGRVNPELIYSDCALDIPELDAAAVLESALAGGKVRQALAELAPAHPGYRALKQALARYREIAARGGWPAVPAGPTLRPGERGERVAALRARLEASGDLIAGDPAAGDLFDPAL